MLKIRIDLEGLTSVDFNLKFTLFAQLTHAKLIISFDFKLSDGVPRVLDDTLFPLFNGLLRIKSVNH